MVRGITLLPDALRAKPKPPLCWQTHACGNTLLPAVLQERGGTVAEEPLGPQQRLKAILQEDRLDTPQPGSQASSRANKPLPQQSIPLPRM